MGRNQMANSVEPDHTAPIEQSDLGKHCLHDCSLSVGFKALLS